jgi:predicted DNA-binding transcriptional regulator YafY
VRRSTETLSRQWDILELIPREPRSITTAEVGRRLAAQGHDVDVRTVQRDLTTLETKFMLRCRTEGRVNHWYWDRDRKSLEIPRLSGPAAVALLLVRDYLFPLLPKGIADELSLHFANAADALKGTKLERWHERVRMVDRGPLLRAPDIDPAVRDVVYEALLNGCQIEADYTSRHTRASRRLRINPLALVTKHGVLYVVATLWRYQDPRQLALHRMNAAELLDSPAEMPPSFDLDTYIDDGAFGYPVSSQEIELAALFTTDAAAHLHERELAHDQQLEVRDDGITVLRATVPDTQELRWWLLGFGDQVEVVAPDHLRAELEAVAQGMFKKYNYNADGAGS